MAKLLQIERAVGKAHAMNLRQMVLEAQGCVLEVEQEMIETLRECGRLRERMENCERSSLTVRPGSMIAANREIANGLSRPASSRHSHSVLDLLWDTSTETQ